MSLPKLDQPTYELVVPSTKERIRYRPFLVKEEKILLMANEGDESSEQIEAVKQIVRNCIVTTGVKFDSLSTFDLEYIFIKVRSKSVGNIIKLNYKKDDCTHDLGDGSSVPRTCQLAFQLNLDDVVVEGEQGHSNKIELSNGVGVIMKYPDFRMLEEINDMESYEEMLGVIARCIKIIYMGDETYDPKDYTKEELSDFLENLTQDQFQKIGQFFETMPQTAATVNVKCNRCGWKSDMKLKGISDFFA